MTFTGLTEEICQTAWRLVLPAIQAAAATDVINRCAGVVVVLNPHDGEVLFQASVDDDHPQNGMYESIARAKADVSWQTGLTSRQVQQDAPHLYRPRMVKWGGSAIENKLVVAFSGVQAVFDEAISWMMLNWILGICQNEMTKPGGVMDAEDDFIQYPPRAQGRLNRLNQK